MVGHTWERGARRVQRLADAAMHRVTWEEDKADYWAACPKAAERHGAFKERSDIIFRRIERYEADLRRWQRQMSDEDWG